MSVSLARVAASLAAHLLAGAAKEGAKQVTNNLPALGVTTGAVEILKDLSRMAKTGKPGNAKNKPKPKPNKKLKPAPRRGTSVRAAERGMGAMSVTSRGRSAVSAAPVSLGYGNGGSGYTITSHTPQCSRMRGSLILGSVIGATLTGNGPAPCFVASLNPISFSDRLAVQASIYDKFVYHNIRLVYQPAVATSTNGSVFLAIDRDYNDPPSGGSVQTVMDYEASTMGPVWGTHTVSMTRDKNEKRTYFTNNLANTDPRECEQFKFYVYSTGTPANTTLGLVVLHYDIELISPVFAPSEIVTGFNFVPVFFNALWAAAGTTATLSGGFAAASNGVYELITSSAPTAAALLQGAANGQALTLTDNATRLWFALTSGSLTSMNLYLSLDGAVNSVAASRIYSSSIQNLFAANTTCWIRRVFSVPTNT